MAKQLAPVEAKKPATKTRVDFAKEAPYAPYTKVWTAIANKLNLRRGAGTTRGIITTLPKGEEVSCYGYYTKVGTTI